MASAASGGLPCCSAVARNSLRMADTYFSPAFLPFGSVGVAAPMTAPLAIPSSLPSAPWTPGRQGGLACWLAPRGVASRLWPREHLCLPQASAHRPRASQARLRRHHTRPHLACLCVRNASSAWQCSSAPIKGGLTASTRRRARRQSAAHNRSTALRTPHRSG
jgi:hypothetical protein